MDTKIVARLDSFSSNTEEASFSFSDSQGKVKACCVEEVLPRLRELEQSVNDGLHAVGFISYEAASGLNPYLKTYPSTEVPLLHFELFAQRHIITPGWELPESEIASEMWIPSVDHHEYAMHLETVRSHLSAGNSYQVNYTYRMHTGFNGNELAVYAGLCRSQFATYCAFLDFGRDVIISASPELFFRLNGRHIKTRPMKGTSQRGRWSEEDNAFAYALCNSEKERAENVMITDMMRNDLGKLSEPGSVKVDEMFRIERFPTVLQMTSTICSYLRPDVGFPELMNALFPCASVTGAPKIRTMEIISQLETLPRGIYTGCIGYLSPGGQACFNVAIRTAHYDKEKMSMEYGVGSGITWDSCSESEYRECIAKAQILNVDSVGFDLFETILWEDGEYFLLDRHIKRLEESVNYWGFVCDLEAVRGCLIDAAKNFDKSRVRVKIQLSIDGDISLESNPLIVEKRETFSVALARSPINSSNCLLFHKTTNRSVYDEARSDNFFVQDTLFYNEHGELTEFSIGNLVLNIDGQLYTPPVNCGLLPGTFRSDELTNGRIEEKILTKNDLNIADDIYLINSVRRYVKTFLVERENV